MLNLFETVLLDLSDIPGSNVLMVLSFYFGDGVIFLLYIEICFNCAQSLKLQLKKWSGDTGQKKGLIINDK